MKPLMKWMWFASSYEKVTLKDGWECTLRIIILWSERNSANVECDLAERGGYR